MEPPRTIAEAAGAAQEVLAHALDHQVGQIPPRACNLSIDEDAFALSADAFWLKTPDGTEFHYRRGRRLIANRACADPASEFALHRWGTVYGAIAWLNGLIPIHASAVRSGDAIIGFTGDSGAGKSTLAAALSQRGLPPFCDDTLVVAPSAEGLAAIPSAKAMKLWGDAEGMLRLPSGQPIMAIAGKFSHTMERDMSAAPAPLTDLVFLEDGADIEWAPITGAAKLECALSALYRLFVHSAIADDRQHSRVLLELAGKTRFWRLRRPMSPQSFDAVTDEIAAQVARSLGAPQGDG